MYLHTYYSYRRLPFCSETENRKMGFDTLLIEEHTDTRRETNINKRVTERKIVEERERERDRHTHTHTHTHIHTHACGIFDGSRHTNIIDWFTALITKFCFIICALRVSNCCPSFHLFIFSQEFFCMQK